MIPHASRPLAALTLAIALGCAGEPDEPRSPVRSEIRVVVLADTAYVDFRIGDAGAVGSNLLASFEEVGYDVRALHHWHPDSLRAALANAEVLAIPQVSTLSAVEWMAVLRSQHLDTMITNFVHQGGVLANAGYPGTLDSLFGWSAWGWPDHDREAYAGALRFVRDDAHAAGTTFAGGPDTLSAWRAGRLRSAELPVGAIAPWRNDSSNVLMYAAPVGTGWVVWLGYNWYRAAPVGGQDGGWLFVLDRIGGLGRRPLQRR